MNQNNNNSGSGSSGSSWAGKAAYVGTGIVIGLVIYPFVRQAITKLQPTLDKLFDDLTGRAENLAEKTADILARAKENLRKSESHDEKHGHPHDHDHQHS
jgi:hypothetical protein